MRGFLTNVWFLSVAGYITILTIHAVLKVFDIITEPNQSFALGVVLQIIFFGTDVEFKKKDRGGK